MHRMILSAAAALLAATTVSAEPVLQGRGDAGKDLTNCPPASAGTTGSASPDANAVEKSAILPSAEGHEQSAAPTVQRNGEAVEARTDCPQDAGQPKPKS